MSLLALEDADDGVCACDSGCGWPLPKLRRDFGGPMRPASNGELRTGVCAGVVLWPKELSRDILFLDLEAGMPGRAYSPS